MTGGLEMTLGGNIGGYGIVDWKCCAIGRAGVGCISVGVPVFTASSLSGPLALVVTSEVVGVFDVSFSSGANRTDLFG